MVGEVMKKSYESNVPVKLTLRDTDKQVFGIVIGGSRFKGGGHTTYITGDGFYSYTVRLINLATDNQTAEEDTVTIEAGNIKTAELYS